MSIPQQQSSLPRVWFRVDCMAPNNRFLPRSDQNFAWLPPRPRYSNILVSGPTTGRWYEYNNWETRQVQQPDFHTAVHYKTFSFYLNDQIFWIYPSDAPQNKVGDGSGNPRVGSRPETEGSEESSSSDEYSSNSSDDDRNAEDWVPLKFHCPFPGDTTYTSYATTRALQTTLTVQRANQPSLSQLLPDRYLLPSEQRTTQQPLGGLVGELPILIALIAYSVRPSRVDPALTHCLRQQYLPHNGQRGDGCKYCATCSHYDANRSAGIDRRGVVVRVYYELQSGGIQAGRVQQHTPAQKLALFEAGRYGKFIP